MTRLDGAFIALLVLAGCQCLPDRVVSTTECGKACFEGPGKPGVGVCAKGVWQCDSEGVVTTCTNAVYPSPETCNGLDDDCNGRVDDLPKRACANQCGTGQEECQSGKWADCSAPRASPEICNGKDDDCDGVVDNPDLLPQQTCYNGPWSTQFFGECHPGWLRCSGGHENCLAEALPKAEICNGIDDDCDGLVDEDLGVAVDFVFIIDASGSMISKLANLLLAIADWSSKFAGRPDVRFAIVMAPDPDFNAGPTPKLRLNLSSASTFVASLGPITATGYGDEYVLDASDSVVDAANSFGLTWAPGARRRLVLFTDEYPQSAVPVAPASTGIFGTRVAVSGAKAYIFTELGAGWTQAWDLYAAAAGGSVYSIYGSASDLATALDSIVAEGSCP